MVTEPTNVGYILKCGVCLLARRFEDVRECYSNTGEMIWECTDCHAAVHPSTKIDCPHSAMQNMGGACEKCTVEPESPEDAGKRIATTLAPGLDDTQVLAAGGPSEYEATRYKVTMDALDAGTLQLNGAPGSTEFERYYRAFDRSYFGRPVVYCDCPCHTTETDCADHWALSPCLDREERDS